MPHQPGRARKAVRHDTSHRWDFNLRQMFRKLGIRSRVALTRLYTEPQPGADATDHASL